MYDDYVPQPINTDDIADLPDKYNYRIEEIAEYLHDIWARAKLDDGWTYGPSRNEAKKEHDLLVPYSKLSDEEKQYDRNIATETVKLLIKLGYDINK